jgi:hypothetical protein
MPGRGGGCVVTCAKLLLIVTDRDVRRRLLTTWRDFVIRQPSTSLDSSPDSATGEGPVAFTRLGVREGLSLAVFIVDGGWRREYVCQALAEAVDGYCLLLSGDPAALGLGRGLLQLLGDARPGMVAAAAPGTEDLIREALNRRDESSIPVVDCDDCESVTGLVCALLERVAVFSVHAVPSY